MREEEKMIDLYNGYAIDIDDMNVTLGKKSVRKSGARSGEITLRSCSYFNTVGKALDWFHELMIREALRGDEMITLKEAIALTHEVNQKFYKWLDDNEMLKRL